MTRCLWNADSGSLIGSVRGNRGRHYTTAVQLARAFDGWRFRSGRCSCPMQVNCKHVAAVLVFAGRAGAEPERDGWQHSLGALLPTACPDAEATTPIAIQISAVTDGLAYSLDARLVRPGKRGGWVAGDLSWSGLDVLGHRGYRRQHIEVLRTLYSLYRTSEPSSYVSYMYGTVKSIDLSRFESPQLWPLLDEARRAGVRLLRAGSGDEVPPPGLAVICLDVTAAALGGFSVTPVLRVDDAPRAAAGFIGSAGHGVGYLDGGLRLARLATPAPKPLQEMALHGESLAIPAADTSRFAADYYPALARVCTVSSTDGAFTPPEVLGPALVLVADYRDAHSLELTWCWSYRVGDAEIRNRVDEPDTGGHRDLGAEQRLSNRIDAPLEQFGLRQPDGALVAQASRGGLDTMRFATELQPLLADHPDICLEVTGDPADYREAGGTLSIGVRTEAVPGETDWFDLGITITVEGREVPFRSVFTALASGQEYLLLPNGAYFALDKPELVRLRALIDEARALTDAEETPRISRFQAGLFDDLAELGVVVQQAEEWTRQVQGLRAIEAIDPIPVPPTLRAELRPYQRDGFSWLATLHAHGLGGILADDMGLGKTLQTLALIEHVRRAQPDGWPFLVVAPASVVTNWASEAARFAPDLTVVTLTDTVARSGIGLEDRLLGADVVITSYTLFRLDFDAHAERSWSGLILDEAQYVKNRQAKTYQCARRLGAPIKLAITGTPMENNLMELWALLSITAPGLFPNPGAFADYFAKHIEKTGDLDRLALFRRRIKPLVLRRTKDLVAGDLPAKQSQIREVELSPRHRRIYDKRLQRERQKVLGLLEDVERNRFTILKSLTVLRQLALHPGLVDPTDAQLPSAKIDALVEHMREVVDGGHRALVFSQFTRFLGQVRQRLDTEGIDYCYLDGRTRNRGRAIERFKDGGAPAFLISLKAGGFGLNLTEADYCFLLDPWWNPAVEAQAVDRTHRIGQTRNVMVYRLIARDTIEEKVVALNARKAQLFASVIDDGNAFGAALTAEDIRELVC